MLATGFEDQSLICLYLFDLPEIELVMGKASYFNPAVSSHFLSGYSAYPSRIIRKEMIFHVQSKRKLQISNQIPENIEDLDRSVKTLIQYCTFYCTEILPTDWKSVENNIENDLVKLNP